MEAGKQDEPEKNQKYFGSRSKEMLQRKIVRVRTSGETFMKQCFHNHVSAKKILPGAEPWEINIGRAREGDTRVSLLVRPALFRLLCIFHAPASQARVIINIQLPPSFRTVDVSYSLGPGTILKI